MTASTLKPLNVVSNLDRYGSVVGQPSPERVLRLGKAIKCIIAADGTVSDAELSAFAQLAVRERTPGRGGDRAERAWPREHP